MVLKNKQAEFSNNLIVNELGKNGAFSFVTAFKSNELDYQTFYPKVSDQEAYKTLKQNLIQNNQSYTSTQYDDISRLTKGENEQNPNIILIAIESFSADFLTAFGNKNNLTPNYDKMANESVFLLIYTQLEQEQ